MIFENQADLDFWLAYWQGSLRLQDWVVKASIKRAEHMRTENAAGCCSAIVRLREASIQLLDPIDWHSEDWTQDHEQCLVHELLHLYFQPFMQERDVDGEIFQEQAIDAIAWALVRERRGNTGEPPVPPLGCKA